VVTGPEITIDVCDHPEVDGLSGLHNGVALGTQLMQPTHHDMVYLASLWDMSLDGSVLEPLPGGLVGELDTGDYRPQECLFRAPNEQHDPAPSALPSSRQWQAKQIAPPYASADSISGEVETHARNGRLLDGLEQGCSIQYLGFSGDIDPYLLQHMQFSDAGICDFGDFQYRRVAGEATSAGRPHLPLAKQIPVHFIISKQSTM
jgi:hypothetical protein